MSYIHSRTERECKLSKSLVHLSKLYSIVDPSILHVCQRTYGKHIKKYWLYNSIALLSRTMGHVDVRKIKATDTLWQTRWSWRIWWLYVVVANSSRCGKLIDGSASPMTTFPPALSGFACTPAGLTLTKYSSSVEHSSTGEKLVERSKVPAGSRAPWKVNATEETEGREVSSLTLRLLRETKIK